MFFSKSLWFGIAIVSIIFAIGNMTMGHFEEQTPRLGRVGKFVVIMALIFGISILFGRFLAMIVLAGSIIPLLYIHDYYLKEKRH
jgi:membrane protease YdiL (CAAX protease family)